MMDEKPTDDDLLKYVFDIAFSFASEKESDTLYGILEEIDLDFDPDQGCDREKVEDYFDHNGQAR